MLGRRLYKLKSFSANPEFSITQELLIAFKNHGICIRILQQNFCANALTIEARIAES